MTNERKQGTGDGERMTCSRCGTEAVFIGSRWTHDTDACISALIARLGEARGCIKLLLRCAVPNAKDHPTMWDAWGDASQWLGEDRNAHRTPHVDLQGNARATISMMGDVRARTER